MPLMNEELQMGHETGTCSCFACFALLVGGGGGVADAAAGDDEAGTAG